MKLKRHIISDKGCVIIFPRHNSVAWTLDAGAMTGYELCRLQAAQGHPGIDAPQGASAGATHTLEVPALHTGEHLPQSNAAQGLAAPAVLPDTAAQEGAAEPSLAIHVAEGEDAAAEQQHEEPVSLAASLLPDTHAAVLQHGAMEDSSHAATEDAPAPSEAAAAALHAKQFPDEKQLQGERVSEPQLSQASNLGA